ncbi:MAG: hypothetical protein DRP08_03540, partial [Candidatus Aenigmatarchaeota archaeon]
MVITQNQRNQKTGTGGARALPAPSPRFTPWQVHWDAEYENARARRVPGEEVEDMNMMARRGRRVRRGWP